MSHAPDEPPSALSRPQLRSLQHDLLGARDQQILRVVAMVDQMPQRGVADDFIAPLRPRLAFLRPERRMNFTRLLFQPLDSMIVAPSGWRRGALSIPRSALQPLSAVVRTHLGDDAARIDRSLIGMTTDHDEQIGRVGPELWVAGATALEGATVPEGWTDGSGLPEVDFAAVVSLVAPMLRRAAGIGALVQLPPTDHAAQKRDIEELLLAAIADGPNAFAALVALLAARLPRSDYVFMVADDVAARRAEPELRLAVDRAIDATIDAIGTEIAQTQRIDQATGELRRVVVALEDLEAQCAQRVSRKARLAQLRQTIDSSSRQQFAAALDAQLLLPAQSIVEANDSQIIGLETAARDLRRFEAIARRLGSGEHYDRHLKGAAAALKPQPNEPVQTAVDRMRLIEILRGPEAAAAAMTL
jgi:hypothetical protein